MLLAVIPALICGILLTVDQAGRSTFGAWLARFDSEDITSIPDMVGWIPAPIWKLAFRFLVSCVRAHV
jgi:hypothetical protein